MQPEIAIAMAKDLLYGCGAITSAVAVISDGEFWVVNDWRPGVFPSEPRAMHFDLSKPHRERFSYPQLNELPEGLDWQPGGSFFNYGPDADAATPRLDPREGLEGRE